MTKLTVTFAAPGPAITLNKRMHWRTEAKHKKDWRDAAYWGALMSTHPGQRHLEGRWLATISYPVKSLLIRRDPHNWVRTSKWILDGFVLARLLVDDDQLHLATTDATFHTQPANLVLVTLEELPCPPTPSPSSSPSSETL